MSQIREPLGVEQHPAQWLHHALLYVADHHLLHPGAPHAHHALDHGQHISPQAGVGVD